MKKFVRRVMAAAMAAAMVVLSTGNMSMALAGEAAALDISKRVFNSGADPTNNADGSISFSGKASQKCSFALPETLVAGDSIKVNVKLKFNSAADAGVRFYLIANGVDANTAKEIQTIANEGTGTEIEKSFTLTAAADSTELLFASSGYGVSIEDVTIYEITLGDKPAAKPDSADGLTTLDISKRVFNSGADPVNNADGSISFSGKASQKCSFALPETLVAGNSVTVNVKLKFNSDADAGVRFYLIANGTDSNIAKEIQTIANDSTGTVIEKSFTLTAAADSTELLFASSGYGVSIEDVTIYEITLGDKPAEEPKDDKPAIEVTEGEYVIKAGDTLSEIAKAYNLTVKDLVDANNIANPNLIFKGAKLVIPTVDTSKRHVVVSGDTLFSIAKNYGCTVAEIASANGIENVNFIMVGQLIVLP